MGVLAVFAVSAMAAASASAAPHFYLCYLQSGGAYENALCNKTGAKLYELEKAPEGTRLNVLSTQVTSYKLKSELLGVKIEIICAAEHGEGWIENPSGGGAGLDLTTNSFSTCEVKKPSGCTVAQPIVATSKTELVERSGTLLDLFTPDETGTTFVKVKLENCGLLNGTYNIEGYTQGAINNAAGTLSFSKEGNGLKFGGNEAEFKGESSVTLSGLSDSSVLVLNP